LQFFYKLCILIKILDQKEEVAMKQIPTTTMRYWQSWHR